MGPCNAVANEPTSTDVLVPRVRFAYTGAKRRGDGRTAHAFSKLATASRPPDAHGRQCLERARLV